MSDDGAETVEEKRCSRARAVGGGFECLRCALAWDEKDSRPICAPLTLERLLDALNDEACRIEASQVALVKVGDRQFRHQGQLRRAQELRAAMRALRKARERQVI